MKMILSLMIIVSAFGSVTSRADGVALVADRNAVWAQRDGNKSKSESLFSMLLEKGSAFWWAQDGKHFCVQPDGSAKVAENMIREAKKYGLSFVADEGGKICGSFAIRR